MRYLNRIIFINSATIRHASIQLDGNIHFIGTQGVGKSTLLRALLFFYNADTQKLGIPVEKKNYADYYFPHSDSYIIYEVMRETGTFCVLSFKAMNRICFRFIDSAYRPELFIGKDNAAFCSPDEIRAVLDRNKVAYSNLINTYEEYRNILYGNAQGRKDYRKYSLMESKQYQNIPRTIQNVLLNSKLEAEFIKQTIISSLNEEEACIDLNRYKSHLADFETQIKDIAAFRQPAIAKQAESIAQLCVEMDYAERQMADNARELFVSYQKALKESPILEGKLRTTEEACRTLKSRKEAIDKKSEEKCRKLHNEIAVYQRDLTLARKREAEYEQMNIRQIIERMERYPELKAQEYSLREEQKILETQFQEVTTKYDALIQVAQNQLSGFLNEKERQRLTLEQQFGQRKEELQDSYRQQEEERRINNEHQLEHLRGLQSKAESILHEHRFMLRQWKQEALYREEIADVQRKLLSCETGIQQMKNSIAHARLSIDGITKQWDAELQGKEQHVSFQQEVLKKKAKTLKEEIERIDLYIADNKDSLYGWLNEHQKGWEETIGKVCDEEILYQKELNPQKAMDAASDTFFGIRLRLDQIGKQPRTLEDLQKEKQQLEQQLTACQQESDKLVATLEADKEKLKRKYQSQIKELKERIRQESYEQERAERNRQQEELALADWKKRAAHEQEERLREQQLKMEAAEKEVTAIQADTAAFREQKEKESNARRSERDKAIRILLREMESKKQLLSDECEKQKSATRQQCASYEAEKQKKLKEQGADTERLQAILYQLNKIAEELHFISEHRDTVAIYRKEKRDLLDKVPEYKQKKKQLEEQLLQEEEHHRLEVDSLKEKLNRTYEQCRSLESDIRANEENCKAYEQIPSLDWYNSIVSFLNVEACIKVKTERTCKVIIEELTRIYMNLFRKLTSLRKTVNEFTGNFSTSNLFSFPTLFVDDKAYVAFASDLRDFMEEHKIEEFEKRVNERHTDLFRQISNDTTDLTSKESAIQKIINRINNDFDARNFVGVIQKIEMRMDDSSNKIVQTLRAIKMFNDEHSHDLGVANLFSSGNEGKIKAQATELLRGLIREITACKNEMITLSDTFELKFRVVENQNDTGFVERLSNVGSEGTDVLVKAMINIMLLNVFKEGASRKFKDFKLHCMMDEIGKLHPENITGILKFANDRNILLVNGSPTELNSEAYRHIYKLGKDDKSCTRIYRIITHN